MSKKRDKKKHHNWHHRRPRSLGGDSSDRNMIQVDAAKHIAWHQLFRNYNPIQIAIIINNVWLDSDWELVARRKE